MNIYPIGQRPPAGGERTPSSYRDDNNCQPFNDSHVHHHQQQHQHHHSQSSYNDRQHHGLTMSTAVGLPAAATVAAPFFLLHQSSPAEDNSPPPSHQYLTSAVAYESVVNQNLPHVYHHPSSQPTQFGDFDHAAHYLHAGATVVPVAELSPTDTQPLTPLSEGGSVSSSASGGYYPAYYYDQQQQHDIGFGADGCVGVHPALLHELPVGQPAQLLSASSTAAAARRRRRAKSNEAAQVRQRYAANQRERRRMLSINGAFEKLRYRIPTLPYEKRLSKVDTLRLAINYIRHLEQMLKEDEANRQDGGKFGNNGSGGRRQTVKPPTPKKIIIECRTGAAEGKNDLRGHSLGWTKEGDITDVGGSPNKKCARVWMPTNAGTTAHHPNNGAAHSMTPVIGGSGSSVVKLGGRLLDGLESSAAVSAKTPTDAPRSIEMCQQPPHNDRDLGSTMRFLTFSASEVVAAISHSSVPT